MNTDHLVDIALKVADFCIAADHALAVFIWFRGLAIKIRKSKRQARRNRQFL